MGLSGFSLIKERFTTYLDSESDVELGSKVRIFAALADSLVRTKFPNAKPLWLYFEHSYFIDDTPSYGLGYGAFSTWVYDKRKTFEGIKIVVKDSIFNIKKLLLLVNASYENIDFVKETPLKHLTRMRYHDADSLASIPVHTIEKYSSTPDSSVDKLLRAKWYQNSNNSFRDTAISYYFQDNYFHFWDPQARELWSDADRKRIPNANYGSPILKVANFSEVFGSENDGHFVFLNDSVFHLIPPAKDTFLGPFTLPNIKPGRRAIMRYDHDKSSTNKYLLYVYERDNDTKILFLPDSNLIVANYGVLEDSLINSIIQKRNGVEIPTDPSGPVPVMLVLLGVCILIIIGLARRQKR